ncbi:hypothetical protein [Nocardioides speluncae]|uniref:DUF7919 family protein n=1 Tax=Nocardioides speluncae TaxID=2670337 RepID=UPI001F0C7C42|nr:hypothetical protein [Nocardioides speluncae]
MINVGWLSASETFPTGVVSPAVFSQLLKHAENQKNIMRGVHDCEFCDEESPVRMSAPTDRGYVSLGMGELHVSGSDGRLYAAPSLILHYIDAHHYLPPAEFIEAVECQESL